MSFSVQLYQAIDELDPKIRKVLIDLLNEVQVHMSRVATREDFRELKKVVESLAVTTKELAEAQQRTETRVEELAEAQKRTEQRVEELAEAQKRTEKRLDELAEAQKRTEQRVQELAEAQKRTEQRVQELAEAQKRTEQRVEELAEAQKRTEKRLDELAEAQKRTEARLERLAEAQAKTETELRKLVQEHRKTREQLGGLAHTVGYRLEDEAFKALPALLKRDLGVEVLGRLKRDFLEIGKDRYLEVNIYGTGMHDGAECLIIGEAKTQLKKKDVDTFLQKAGQVASLVPKEQVRLLVTYQASPPVQKYVRDQGIFLYFSYDF
ncbi:MAG: hypothetical protein WHS86_12995 [Desulfosoma sp.]